MNSVLMCDTNTGVVATTTGSLDLSVMVRPMINISKDLNNGLGIGVRYFSLLDGEDGFSRFSAPGDRFHGRAYGDLSEFDTTDSSELPDFKRSFRKQVHWDLTLLVGYRDIDLGEKLENRARNFLPQQPPIEFSSTDLTNRFHDAQAALVDWPR